MDGLECSEIRMSDVCDTTTLRFDSDYYKKEYLEIEQFICKNRDKFVGPVKIYAQIGLQAPAE